jgi:hypothetical protein
METEDLKKQRLKTFNELVKEARKLVKRGANLSFTIENDIRDYQSIDMPTVIHHDHGIRQISMTIYRGF